MTVPPSGAQVVGQFLSNDGGMVRIYRMLNGDTFVQHGVPRPPKKTKPKTRSRSAAEKLRASIGKGQRLITEFL